MRGGRYRTSQFRWVLHKCHYLILIGFVALFLYSAPQINFRSNLKSNQITEIDLKLKAPCYYDCFSQALKNHASSDGFIVLAMVDVEFVDMALNFYYTSLLPHNINNFLFVGSGRQTCRILYSHSIPCFLYSYNQDAEKASRFMSKTFLHKMYIKTEIITAVLNEGYSILFTDIDLHFFANPIPELKEILKTSDMAAMQDGTTYNSGFFVIKPTNNSILTYKIRKRITDVSPEVGDQTALNDAIKQVITNYPRARFNAAKLHHIRYGCGLTYFEEGNNLFAEDRTCSNYSNNSIVVHNNFIVGREAKIYRLKELHMWMVDRDQYYTNPKQKYLVYDNPIDDWDSDASATTAELNALRTALAIGQITGRVVILPRFHCGSSHLNGTSISLSGRSKARKLHKLSQNSDDRPISEENTTSVFKERSQRECPLNCLLDLTAFDAEFDGLYRESSFLTHPLVNIPASHYSQPQNLGLPNPLNKIEIIPSVPSNASSFQITESFIVEHKSMSEKTIAEKFGSKDTDKLENDKIRNARVLVFHNLYGFNITFSNVALNKEFNLKIKRAFKRLEYRQLPPAPKRPLGFSHPFFRRKGLSPLAHRIPHRKNKLGSSLRGHEESDNSEPFQS